MIKLTEDLFIAKGTERACYRHPTDSSRCIKVSHSGINKQQQQEIAYLNFLLKKNKFPCDFLPNFFGSIETNQGEGLVFERIYNEDGSAIESLRIFIKNHGYSEQLTKALAQLKFSLLKHNIIVRDLNINNVLVKKIGTDLKLIMIDGIGNSDFIPLANYIDWYAQKKIQRRWARFENKLLQYIQENKFEVSNGSLA